MALIKVVLCAASGTSISEPLFHFYFSYQKIAMHSTLPLNKEVVTIHILLGLQMLKLVVYIRQLQISGHSTSGKSYWLDLLTNSLTYMDLSTNQPCYTYLYTLLCMTVQLFILLRVIHSCQCLSFYPQWHPQQYIYGC